MSQAPIHPLGDVVQQGWADHERDPEGVLARLEAALEHATADADLPAPTALIVHVAAEHLGRPQDGLRLLARLAELPAWDEAAPGGQAVLRGQASLLLCAGERAAAEEALLRAHPAGSALPEASTRVRVLAVAASALAAQGRAEEAAATFAEALALAAYGPGAEDPAARALAVTGNNLACALEERRGRTETEDRLLEEAAQAGRRFWEIAGTWSQVQVAEYRLAHTYLALGRAPQALVHAQACEAICAAEGAGPFDRFFAWEALAKTRHAAGEATGAAAARDMARIAAGEVDEASREYVSGALVKLEALLAE